MRATLTAASSTESRLAEAAPAAAAAELGVWAKPGEGVCGVDAATGAGGCAACLLCNLAAAAAAAAARCCSTRCCCCCCCLGSARCGGVLCSAALALAGAAGGRPSGGVRAARPGEVAAPEALAGRGCDGCGELSRAFALAAAAALASASARAVALAAAAPAALALSSAAGSAALCARRRGGEAWRGGEAEYLSAIWPRSSAACLNALCT